MSKTLLFSAIYSHLWGGVIFALLLWYVLAIFAVF